MPLPDEPPDLMDVLRVCLMVAGGENDAIVRGCHGYAADKVLLLEIFLPKKGLELQPAHHLLV